MPGPTQADPVILTITTGLSGGGSEQKNYNYVGTFPGILAQPGTPFPGGAPIKQLVSYRTGVTAPWAQRPIKFKV